MFEEVRAWLRRTVTEMDRMTMGFTEETARDHDVAIETMKAVLEKFDEIEQAHKAKLADSAASKE
jgi:hypothetical protein